MNYYKGLFGSPDEGNFSMDETRTADIPQVSIEENNLLTALYSEEEVKKAIFQMEYNKAPGPDGFPAKFYQNFWEVIKVELLELFSFLHSGQLVRLFYYLRLLKQKGSNNIGLSVFLMLVLRYSQRWPQSNLTRWLIDSAL
jgi:hypothetical protein